VPFGGCAYDYPVGGPLSNKVQAWFVDAERHGPFGVGLSDVDAKTEFWGPKGGDRGTGPKGLADECMAKGYEIKVMPAKDPTVAKDVYLPNRKPK